MGTFYSILLAISFLCTIWLFFEVIGWIFRKIFGIPSALELAAANSAGKNDASKPRYKVRLPLDLEIKYRSKDGEINQRKVTVDAIKITENATFLEGFCHLRNEERTFKLNRIIGDVVDTDSGEIVDLKSTLSL